MKSAGIRKVLPQKIVFLLHDDLPTVSAFERIE